MHSNEDDALKVASTATSEEKNNGSKVEDTMQTLWNSVGSDEEWGSISFIAGVLVTYWLVPTSFELYLDLLLIALIMNMNIWIMASYYNIINWISILGRPLGMIVN